MLRQGMLLVLLLSLSGCFSQKYSVQQLEQGKKCVVFEQQVEMPDQLLVKAASTHGSSGGIGGGDLTESAVVLAALLAINATAEILDRYKYGSPSDIISKHMIDNRIHVDEMLLDEFKQVFSQKVNLDECSGKLAGSFVKVTLQVKKIGLYQISNHSPLLRPVMNLRVVFSDEHDKVIWQYYKRFRRKNHEIEACTMQRYLEEPESLKRAYESLFEHAVADAVQGFH